MKSKWQWNALKSMLALLGKANKLLLMNNLKSVASPDVLYVEFQIGRLLELLRKRKYYNKSIKRVMSSQWLLLNKDSRSYP
jgi:hypothetical protein